MFQSTRESIANTHRKSAPIPVLGAALVTVEEWSSTRFLTTLASNDRLTVR
ncbi:hypothetical protein RRSWK_00966 [Rhodopirellula sp. SWK7]|nr:hypothetical protein RRSWK_00966 [Rhodopirellula sp. SWK7]